MNKASDIDLFHAGMSTVQPMVEILLIYGLFL